MKSIATGNLPTFLSSKVRESMARLQEEGLTTFALTSLLQSHLLNLADIGNDTTTRRHANVIYDQLVSWMDIILRIPEGRQRALDVHSLAERAIEKAAQAYAADQAPSCHKGCSFCCHTQVSIGGSEGEFIKDYADRHNIDWDRGKARAQADQQEPHLYPTRLSWSESACVFLNPDGACRIYEARPLSCRKLVVVSQPQLCDPRDKNSPSYLMNLEAEIISAAFYNVELSTESKIWPLPAYLSKGNSC